MPFNELNHSFRLLLPYWLALLLLIATNGYSANNKSIESSNNQLSDYILIEMALLRNQSAKAYQLINKMTEQALHNSTFVQLYSQLKARKHQEYRYQLVQAWRKQHPEEKEVILAVAREDACSDNTTNLDSLRQAFSLMDDHTDVARLLSCIDERQQVQILTTLASEDNSSDIIQLAACNSLLRAEENSAAISCYEGLEMIDDLESLRSLARLYHQEGKINQAVNLYTNILSQTPQDVTVRYELAGIYYDLGQFSSSIEVLEILTQQSRKNRNAQYLLAASHYALKQWDDSRFWFEQLLVSKQFRNRAFYYLGMIAIEQNELRQAMRFLRSVEPSDEYLAAQLNYWPLVAVQDGDLERAIDGLYGLIDKMPENRMAIKLAQIDIYDAADEVLKATQELVALADDYPRHLRLQILRIQWLIDQDYTDRVSANLNASLNGLQEQEDKQQLVRSTLYHLIEQEYGLEATDILTEQSIIVPDSEQYQFIYALTQAVAKNYPAAIEILEHLLKQSPQRHDLKNALGYIYTLEGSNFAKAELLISTALSQVPGNPAYLDSIGWLKFKQGYLLEAEEYLERANQLSSEPTIKAHLVELYLAQDRVQEAQKLLKEAMVLFPRSNRILALAESFLNLGVNTAND